MKAVIHPKYGAPEVLQLKEVKEPVCKDNEVMVKVYAATVNRTDCAMLRAKPFIMRFYTGLFNPKSPVPGTDFAGEIVSLGSKVSSFKIGDRVFGFADMGLGSHAEYMTIREDEALDIIPENINYKQAAASIEGAHYAVNFFNKVELEPGQRVLINGATGAIGSAALQIAKYYGAKVDAVCEGKNRELVKSLGADVIYDYNSEDFTKSNEKYDYIFDAVGKSSFGKCKKILCPGGIYISSELGKNSENIFYSLFTPIFGNKKVKFPFPTDRPRSVRFIKKLMADGKFEPIIDREYPIEEIIKAFKYVETGQKLGNVVININQ